MKIPTQYQLIMPIGQFKAMWQCSDATWWPTLEPMQVAPPDDQILNQCKFCHLLAKFETDTKCTSWWPNLQTIDEASYVGNIFFLQMKGDQKVTAPDSVVPVWQYVWFSPLAFTISPWGCNIFWEIWQERKVKAKGENDTLAKTQRSPELSLGPRTAFNQITVA